MRESAIESTGVIGGGEDLLERRVEVACGFAAFVEVAGSIVEGNAAVKSYRSSPRRVVVERQERERAGVNRNQVADYIGSTCIYQANLKRDGERSNGIVAGRLLEKLVDV